MASLASDFRKNYPDRNQLISNLFQQQSPWSWQRWHGLAWPLLQNGVVLKQTNRPGKERETTKTKKKPMRRFLLTVACLAGVAACQVANAEPVLQLDIAGGWYDTTDETTIASANSFALYALLNNRSSAGTYYVSAALIPKAQQTTPPPSLGSFKIGIDLNGNGIIDGSESWKTIAVASQMTYGTAPIEMFAALQGFDSGDLPKHGIFETYFSEFAFTFNGSLKTERYDTQTGSHPLLPQGGSPTMYYMPFLVDVSGLDQGYGIHFDLYDEKAYTKAKCNNPAGDIDVNDFAPFSHDATGMKMVPDGGTTAALLGLGVLGLGFFARRKA
jgi:hypothetical protein